MKSWMIMLACAALGLSAAGCRDKLADCKKTCADLEKEYMAKCTGPGADTCKESMAKTTVSCNKVCDDAMK